MREIFEKLKIFNIDPSKLRSPDFYADLIRERDEFWEKRAQLNKTDDEACCNLCKSGNGKLFLEYRNYKLFECLDCSCVYANIRVADDYDKIIYDNDFYKENNKREVLDTYDYRKNLFAKERLEYITNKCDFNKESDKLLDLGCGYGYFLKYLTENDIECCGLELTDFFVEVCQEKGLNVKKTFLEDEDDNSYNIITMFDVLEHLSDPLSFFHTAHKKLKSGGHLLAYTPNIHSFAFYFQKGKQNLLLPYEHLSFYDAKSLDYLAKKSGFEVTSVEYFGLDLVDYFSMKEYEDGVSYNEKLSDVIPYLQALIDDAKLSNHLRVAFKKI